VSKIQNIFVTVIIIIIVVVNFRNIGIVSMCVVDCSLFVSLMLSPLCSESVHFYILLFILVGLAICVSLPVGSK